jgi:peptide/nickel transport system permease protein
VTPKLPRRRTPSPTDRAAIDAAAKRLELGSQPSSPGDDAQEVGTATDRALNPAVLVRPGSMRIDSEVVDPASPADPEGVGGEGSNEFAALSTSAQPVPLWRQMLEVYLQNKLAIASTFVLLVIVLGCFVGPHLYVTNQTNANSILGAVDNASPSAAHLLGTDNQGWDELGRIMYGGEYSLTLGFFAGLITIVIGTIYGMASGFFGGITDAVLMRIIDAALAIPYLFLLVALVSIFHNSTTFLLLVIGLTGWWGNSRIIRGDALAIRDLEYSLAATSMGATKAHVIRRHVFPNSISNVVTVGTFSIADAILALSALGFIGFGIQQPAVDWGTMMNFGTQELIENYWWEIYPVAVVFVVVILCINYIGDALRDVFEVRLRQR